MNEIKEYKPLELDYNVHTAVENLKTAYWSNEPEKVATAFKEAEDIIISAICHNNYTVCKELQEVETEKPQGDLISRSVVKGMISDKSISIKFEEEKRGNWQNSLGMILSDIYNVIDNAPTVEPCYQTTSCLDCGNYDKENHNCPRFCEVIRNLVNEVKERPQGEWIPVDERLPDKEGRCLVTTDYGDVYMDNFRDGLFVLNLWDVIAWQPLPEPYQKGGTE